MVLVKCDSTEKLSQILRNLRNLKTRYETSYGQLRVRPDYSLSELTLYKEFWKKAKELNDQTKLYQWTIKKLKLVKLAKPTRLG